MEASTARAESLHQLSPGGLSRRRLWELLGTSGVSPAAQVESTPLPAPGHFPWLTAACLAAFCVVFGLEHHFAIRPDLRGQGVWGLNVPTLIALGGVDRHLLTAGGVYRLFTSPWLHADLVHLSFNVVAFGLAGACLEPLLGRAWLSALCLAGALGGSLLSVALNAEAVSVGASGAILALFSAGVMLSRRLPPGPRRARARARLLQVLIPSLVPAVTHLDGGTLDLAAHLGGALTGAALGAVLLGRWPREGAAVPLRALALAIAAAGVVAVGVAASQVERGYLRWQGLFSLAEAPDLAAAQQAIDQGPDQAVAAAAQLVTRYPKDPRAHLMHAMALERVARVAEGVKELRALLADPHAFDAFEPALAQQARATLAAMLVDLGRLEEAKFAADPLCGAQGKPAEMVQTLGLCAEATGVRSR